MPSNDTSDRPVLTLIAGAPCSGRNRWRKAQADRLPATVYGADAVGDPHAVDEQGLANWTRSSIVTDALGNTDAGIRAWAWRTLTNWMEEHLRTGRSFGLRTTLANDPLAEKAVTAARAAGYRVHCHFIGTGSAQRNAGRTRSDKADLANDTAALWHMAREQLAATAHQYDLIELIRSENDDQVTTHRFEGQTETFVAEADQRHEADDALAAAIAKGGRRLTDNPVADLDRQITELQEQRRAFVEELPVREERREQLAGKALMKAFRDGNTAAASWLELIVETAKQNDEAWLFEAEYLEADGYEQFETDGKKAWKHGRNRRTCGSKTTRRKNGKAEQKPTTATAEPGTPPDSSTRDATPSVYRAMLHEEPAPPPELHALLRYLADAFTAVDRWLLEDNRNEHALRLDERIHLKGAGIIDDEAAGTGIPTVTITHLPPDDRPPATDTYRADQAKELLQDIATSTIERIDGRSVWRTWTSAARAAEEIRIALRGHEGWYVHVPLDSDGMPYGVVASLRQSEAEPDAESNVEVPLNLHATVMLEHLCRCVPKPE